MRVQFWVWVLLCVCSVCRADESGLAASSEVASGPREYIGTQDGAAWRVDVPAQWNGELMLFLHGYEPAGSPRPEIMDKSGLEDTLMSLGIAVAQSRYSTQGWAVAEALVENEWLRVHAESLLGEPRRTWVMGTSMGGHLTLASLEAYPGAYDGGVSLCGANASAAQMFHNEMVPPLMAFEHFFPGVLGLAEGGLADPASPPWPDPQTIELALRSNESVAAELAERWDIPRGGLAGGLMIRYGVLHELIERAGGFPVETSDLDFSGLGESADIHDRIRRYRGDADAVAYAAANRPLTGETSAPVLLLSNVDDPTIPDRISSRYLQLAASAGRDALVRELPRRGLGHCAFHPEDILEAVSVLREWVSAGVTTD